MGILILMGLVMSFRPIQQAAAPAWLAVHGALAANLFSSVSYRGPPVSGTVLPALMILCNSGHPADRGAWDAARFLDYRRLYSISGTGAFRTPHKINDHRAQTSPYPGGGSVGPKPLFTLHDRAMNSAWPGNTPNAVNIALYPISAPKSPSSTVGIITSNCARKVLRGESIWGQIHRVSRLGSCAV